MPNSVESAEKARPTEIHPPRLNSNFILKRRFWGVSLPVPGAGRVLRAARAEPARLSPARARRLRPDGQRPLL
jgi:hypothetical protein